MIRDLSEDRNRWKAVCLVLAAFALGMGIQVRDGLVAPAAIAWLTVAIACTFAATLTVPDRLMQRAGRFLPHLLAAAVLIQLALHLAYHPPESWYGAHSLLPYYGGLTLACIATVGLIFVGRPIYFAIAIAAFLIVGGWLLIAGPKPKMDVWMAQTAGLDAALRGQDPWSSSFPDLYRKPDLYAPGTVRDGRTHLGFPYPPMAFWMDLPGYLLTGDYRWSNLIEITLAAILIRLMMRGSIGQLAALLFLFTPRALLVLRNGWTEPTIALLLTATIYTVLRRPRWTPWLLGLLLASKQYMFIAVVPAYLLMPEQSRKHWCAKVVSSGLIASLPLILWNYRGYLHANFAAASGAAFRYDAMSYFAFWADTHNWTPPAWIASVSLLAAIPVTLWSIRRAERSPTGFASALGLVMIVFFALNKFAFCNYYYLVIATLCTAVGSLDLKAVEAKEMSCDNHLLRLAA